MLTMRNDPASPLALTFKPIAAAIAPEPVSGCPGASTADATFPASSATEPSAAEGGLAAAPPIAAAAKTGALRENVPRRVAAARPSAPAAHQVRRSMHQDCLLKGRNFVFYPSFTHFPPSFAHFHRLDARNPENAARSPGESGKNREKRGEMGVINSFGRLGHRGAQYQLRLWRYCAAASRRAVWPRRCRLTAPCCHKSVWGEYTFKERSSFGQQRASWRHRPDLCVPWVLFVPRYRSVEPGREIKFLHPAKRSQCLIVEQIAPVVERPVGGGPPTLSLCSVAERVPSSVGRTGPARERCATRRRPRGRTWPQACCRCRAP